MSYHQLTSGERYELSALRKQGLSQADIARALNRHPSTICRELRRNKTKNPRPHVEPRQDWYVPSKAHKKARGRRSRSRRNRHFKAHHWDLVIPLLRQLWSPEQISGWLRLHGSLRISHETIYQYIWRDRRHGGDLYRYLRGAQKQRRKRYGRYDSRGRLAGKRSIAERSAGAQNRSRTGHLEGDTVMGSTANRHCILTLVDRKTGYVMIGKLAARTAQEASRRTISLIQNAPRRTHSLTLDNGTEFHDYKAIERATQTKVFFATPHHSWERGTNENTNGLIRQFLPKRASMAHVTQHDCERIAKQLNDRPRKRLGWLTPRECYEQKKAT
jgi:transposase, IS30 family